MNKNNTLCVRYRTVFCSFKPEKEVELKDERIIHRNKLMKKIPGFIGESDAVKKVFTIIDKVADTDANVLILGEHGTGKELTARAIHKQSGRKNGPFVSVDMGTINENLFESELFGHEKGAFTDAKTEKAGRFELAGQGTLFLDEIGNLSLAMQAKLLSAIEKREIYRVGSNIPIKTNIRLICATNVPLHVLADESIYRQDLLYRINTVEINLPPLRNRQNDIPVLADYFLNYYAQKYQKKITAIDKKCMQQLMAYNWPGNVRQLQHQIERMVILAAQPVLTADDFTLQNTAASIDNIDLPTCNLAVIEKSVINKALILSAGNISKASQLLGLTRTSLYRRMQKYKL